MSVMKLCLCLAQFFFATKYFQLSRFVSGLMGGVMVALMALPVSAQNNRCALILLHERLELPQSLESFRNSIEPECKTLNSEMPWSKGRSYDVDLSIAIAEIKAQVSSLRNQGFKKVVLVGKGLGSNVAYAYMAAEGNVDGIVVMSVFAFPVQGPGQPLRDAMAAAKNMISAGKGNDVVEMPDQSQGQRISVPMRASILASYFDPEGLGHMPGAASRFKKSIPVLWVAADKDQLLRLGSKYAFDKVPLNQGSQYLLVNASRSDVSEKAVEPVLYWLKSLE